LGGGGGGVVGCWCCGVGGWVGGGVFLSWGWGGGGGGGGFFGGGGVFFLGAGERRLSEDRIFSFFLFSFANEKRKRLRVFSRPADAVERSPDGSAHRTFSPLLSFYRSFSKRSLFFTRDLLPLPRRAFRARMVVLSSEVRSVAVFVDPLRHIKVWKPTSGGGSPFSFSLSSGGRKRRVSCIRARDSPDRRRTPSRPPPPFFPSPECEAG